MNKGGYKIVNFNGTALSGTEVTLAGIYDQIVDDYDKPIMVSGVILSGELQDDAYASVKVNDGSVDLTVYGGVITVTEDDEVTFALAKSNTELTADIGDLDDLETTDKDSLVGAINEVKTKPNVLIGADITVPVDLSTTGTKSASFSVPTAPSGYTISGYIGRSASQRYYYLGFGGAKAYYNVVETTEDSFNLILNPIYKKS